MIREARIKLKGQTEPIHLPFNPRVRANYQIYLAGDNVWESTPLEIINPEQIRVGDMFPWIFYAEDSEWVEKNTVESVEIIK